jgi:hypothetical protein
MNIFIEELKLEKNGSNISMLLDISLEDSSGEYNVNLIYLAKKSSVELFCSKEHESLIFDFFKRNLDLEKCNIFDPKFKLDNKEVVIKREIKFIDFFKMSTRYLPLLYQKTILERVQLIKRKSNINKSRELNFNIQKKHKKDFYEIKIAMTSKLSIEVFINEESIYQESNFNFDNFKYFLKSHFGVILASKEKGILSLTKNSIYRNRLEINVVDKIKENSFINLKFYEKDIVDDFITIFENIQEIHGFLYKNSWVYNKGIDIDFDLDIDFN